MQMLNLAAGISSHSDSRTLVRSNGSVGSQSSSSQRCWNGVDAQGSVETSQAQTGKDI